MERDVRLQSLFYISFRVPSKGAFLPGSLYRAPTERDTPTPEPLQIDGMRESDKYWCKNKKSQLRILAIKIYKYRQNTTKYIILYHF